MITLWPCSTQDILMKSYGNFSCRDDINLDALPKWKTNWPTSHKRHHQRSTRGNLVWCIPLLIPNRSGEYHFNQISQSPLPSYNQPATNDHHEPTTGGTESVLPGNLLLRVAWLHSHRHLLRSVVDQLDDGGSAENRTPMRNNRNNGNNALSSNGNGHQPTKLAKERRWMDRAAGRYAA